MEGLVVTTLGQCSENIETLDHWQNVCFFGLRCISDCSLVFIHQSAGLAGEDLAKTLEGLGLDEGGQGGGEDGNILPIMQSIMQNLLSKEVLYPSLKEITEKVSVFSVHMFGFFLKMYIVNKPLADVDSCFYRSFPCMPFTQLSNWITGCYSILMQYPEWLNSNRQSLPLDQFQRYEQQHKVMGEICSQFEKEGERSGRDGENRFESILELMQQVRQRGLFLTCMNCWLSFILTDGLLCMDID